MKTDDLRIRRTRPLLAPAMLSDEIPLTPPASELVHASRRRAEAILDAEDPRLLLVVGPCSIHDPLAALEYAGRLKELADEVADALFVIMRVYFEKPRTVIGWKGLINDPDLDGSGSSTRTSSAGAPSARGPRRARSTESSRRVCRCPSASRTARTAMSRSRSTRSWRPGSRTSSPP
jgi:hypothetical protein